jgi:hypothetical protein
LVLLSGKVASETARSVNVDIFFLIEASLSTAHYAGVDFPDLGDLPALYISPGAGGSRPQVSIFRADINIGSGEAPRYNLRNSIFAAETIAARRMLSQLDAQTTRVRVITFSDDARVRQTLTHDFEQVRKTLDEIYRSGPYGGTTMVEGIRLGIKELLGLGTSGQRTDAIKTQLLLTDGLPSLPIDGTTNRANVTVYYQAGAQKSLDLEIFLEKERKLQIEIERLGKSQEDVQLEVERLRRQSGVPAR